MAGKEQGFYQVFGMKHSNGRNGEHTPDLDEALATLSEVYRAVPHAIW